MILIKNLCAIGGCFVQISICEDEIVYQTAIQQAILRWKNASGHMDVTISLYSSSEMLLEQIERKFDIDLLFIDIQIPGEMSGIELARRIREKNFNVTIVFCTNYSEYVYEGYTVNAFRFLRKPVVDDDIYFCCNYAYNRLTLKNTDNLIVFSAGKRYALRYTEIRYLEARSHCVHISTTVSQSPLKISARLSDIISDLPREMFVLCHRSYIVNIAHVRAISRIDCLLLNNERIPLSRTYARDVNQTFDRYHQGGGFSFGMDNI